MKYVLVFAFLLLIGFIGSFLNATFAGHGEIIASLQLALAIASGVWIGERS